MRERHPITHGRSHVVSTGRAGRSAPLPYLYEYLSRGTGLWWLLGLLLVALCLRIYRLSLPGPYGDEVSFVLPAHQMRWGQPLLEDVETFRVLGRALPIAFNPYTGPLPIYAQFLFSYVADAQWFDFRMLDIVYAVGAAAFAYAFARDFLGKREAVLTALFLAVMPSFVFYSRLGEPWHIMRVLLATALLFTLYRWWVTSDHRYFYGSCLCVGLGLSDRLEIVWWTVTIPLAALVVRPATLLTAVKRIVGRPGESATGVGLAVVAAAPFVVYNRHPWRWGTVVYIRTNVATTFLGHHNTALGQNLVIRLRHLVSVLSGADGSAFGLPGIAHANQLSPVVFFGSVLALAWLVLRRRLRRQPDRHVEFLLTATTLMFVLSTFTPTVLAPYQLLMLFPLPVLLVARAVTVLSAPPSGTGMTNVRREAARAVPWLVVAALVAGDLVVNVQYYQALVRTGGVGEFSSGIFPLVDWLRQHRIARIVACDWRLFELVEYASRGTIGGEEVIVYGKTAKDVPPLFVQKMRTLLRRPGGVYVFYAPHYEEYRRRATFLSLLGSRPYDLDILSDRNGPIYYVYRTLPLRPPQPGIPVAHGRPRHAYAPGGTGPGRRVQNAHVDAATQSRQPRQNPSVSEVPGLS